MLNAKGQRELAYLVKIDNIIPIEGADRVEAAIVGGWRIMVKKGQFQIGDIAVYFEIDSKVPEREPFMFLASKHFKIKTQKYFKGTFLSQGLLMSLKDFGDAPWAISTKARIASGKDVVHEGLTEILGVTYADTEDNQRKANSADKYKVMAQRRPDIFKKTWARWMMKREWGRKVMFFFFGKKKDKKSSWPEFMPKTDEERIQNIPFILENKEPWIVTEKIDGSSTSAAVRRKGRRGHEFYICSRNVVFDKPDKACYYPTNIYTEMAERYNFEEVLVDIMNKYNLDWVYLQGETFGEGVQKRDYSIFGHDFAAFNLAFSDRGRLNSVEARAILDEYSIPFVPIVNTRFILPDTVDELLDMATGLSEIDDLPREGFVFRSQDGAHSFKAVSNEFLMEYHG